MSEGTQPADAVRVERTLRAPPERVFRAWLDPEMIRRWMTPGEYVIDHATVDPRVGGRYFITHTTPQGEPLGGFEGEFLEIVPHRKLVYRWAFFGTEPEKGEYFDTLVTVEFRPVPEGGTRVLVVHERLEQLRKGAPQIASQISAGWNSSLDKLTSALMTPTEGRTEGARARIEGVPP